MMRTKLMRLGTCCGRNALMSTGAQGALNEKKLEHYKNLQSLQEKEGKPQGWDEAKPFKDIPGPQPLPIVGNAWRFVIPKLGDFHGKDFLDVQRQLNKQYGEIAVLKGVLGSDAMVMLYNPKDFETLFRNEGIWPIRKNLPSIEAYSQFREGKAPTSALTSYHGEKWFKFRSMVNPILMQPRNMLQYTDKMNIVADQFIDIIKYLSEQNKNGEMPTNFNNEIYKWALESVALVTLDTHLGCMERKLDPDSEQQMIINNTLDFFELLYQLDFRPSLWKYISTPAWRKYVSVLDFLISTNVKYINEALDRLEKEELDNEDGPKSALQQLLKKDRDVAIAMSIDMMQAGIDTTGRILQAGLYYLSKNTETQQKLREEARSLLQTKDTPITKEILAKASYLRACVKETTRLAPIGIGNMRTTVKDLVLAGYQIPKGTDVMSANLVLCTDDEHFPRAGEFLPERWLSKEPEGTSNKASNPFVFAPFGSGPRSCIGKRLATLEIELALLKIIRNFELSWPHEDMQFATRALYGVAEPLKIHVKPLND